MLYVITGPPCAGKSTWVRERAKPGDITIDYDTLACALSPHAGDKHDHTEHVHAVTRQARYAAIDVALTLGNQTNVYVIDSNPSDRDLAKYRSWRAEIVSLDPGRNVVVERAGRRNSANTTNGVDAWYRRVASDVAGTAWFSDMQDIVENVAGSDERHQGWTPPAW